MFDIDKVRQDFPILSEKMHGKSLVYFDSAATGQKPKAMIDSLSNFYAYHYATVHRAIYNLSVHATNTYNSARVKCQHFVNARQSEEIIFTRGRTDAINLVANSVGKSLLNPGDEIIITEMEHHSNIVPWQMIAEERKAILKIIPILKSGDLDLEAFKAMITPRTKIVAVIHLSNVLGTVNPLKKMAEIAHQSGALLMVDGAQAAPHVPIDVQEFDCDFYIFSGHKLFGPNGIGILYGKKELLDLLPPYQGGGAMIEKVTFAKTTYTEPPLKFEAGTPIIAEAIALGSVIDYLNSLELKKVHAHEHSLVQYATEELSKIPGLKILGSPKERASLVAFTIDGIHHLDLGSFLDLRGIAIRTGHLCSQPLMDKLQLTGCSRASFALYNTHQEIDYFIDSLKEIIPVLKNK